MLRTSRAAATNRGHLQPRTTHPDCVTPPSARNTKTDGTIPLSPERRSTVYFARLSLALYRDAEHDTPTLTWTRPRHQDNPPPRTHTTETKQASSWRQRGGWRQGESSSPTNISMNIGGHRESTWRKIVTMSQSRQMHIVRISGVAITLLTHTHQSQHARLSVCPPQFPFKKKTSKLLLSRAINPSHGLESGPRFNILPSPLTSAGLDGLFLHPQRF